MPLQPGVSLLSNRHRFETAPMWGQTHLSLRLCTRFLIVTILGRLRRAGECPLPTVWGSRLFPKGALVFIQTQIPMVDRSGQLTGWRPITRFVLNQDTGGAIRGYQRADIYFGTGDGAGDLAGYMNRPGKMFFVILKDGKRIKDEGEG